MNSPLDRRQLIINELVTLLTNLTGTIALTGTESTPARFAASGFVHNRNELPKEKVPGIILLDADETLSQPQPVMPGRAIMPIAPQIMKFTPEIYVVLDVRKPQNANVGQDLSIARTAIMGAIWTDETLISICGSNGRIVFDACITDLARNRVMAGQLGLSVSFYYPLKPNEIIG